MPPTWSAPWPTVRDTARGEGNLLVPMREALRARATIGEICNTFRDEFGTYDAQR